MVTLRESMAQDESFLLELYRDAREAEVLSWGWTAEQALSFLDMQYDLQKRSYFLQYPSAITYTIETGQRAVGRLILDRNGAMYRIIDITINSAFRGQGIGTKVLGYLQEQCAREKASIALRVVQMNPAIRLYARLGFETAEESDLDIQMVWNSREMYEQKEAQQNV